MTHHAHERAEIDATLSAWTIEDVVSFQHLLDRMPSSGQELFELVKMRLGDLRHQLEQGDKSIAQILAQGASKETEMRNYVANWMENFSHGRYLTCQEEELADAKRPDIRIHGIGIDHIVPIELKLMDMNWSGHQLLERLENQLAGDYLREKRSEYGVFLLIYKNPDAKQKTWRIHSKSLNFTELVDALQQHWFSLQPRYPHIQDIQVVGIDLSARFISPKAQ